MLLHMQIYIILYYFSVTYTKMSYPIHLIEATSAIFSEYEKEILTEFPELVRAFTEKPFRVSHSDIHPKVLADWSRGGLLLTKPERNRMHRFSLAEFVWIKLIQKMRLYNFPLERIISFKNDMVETGENEMDEFLNSQEAINKLVEQMGGGQAEKMKAFFSQAELVKKHLAMLPFDLTKLNLLEGLILFCLIVKRPISFMIDDQGKIFVFSPIFLERKEIDQTELQQLLCRSYVSISLTEVLAETMAMAPIESLSEEIRVITAQEAKVLEALREKNLLSIKIRHDKNHEMDLLEVKTEQKMDKRARLLEMILMNGYQEITLKTENGNIVRCENTRKLKLK